MIYFLALIPAVAAFFGVSYFVGPRTGNDPIFSLVLCCGAAVAAYSLTLIIF